MSERPEPDLAMLKQHYSTALDHLAVYTAHDTECNAHPHHPPACSCLGRARRALRELTGIAEEDEAPLMAIIAMAVAIAGRHDEEGRVLLRHVIAQGDRLQTARDILSGLSSWCGQGMGDASTPLLEYDTRIREGLESLLRVEQNRRNDRDKQIADLRAQVATLQARVAELTRG